MKKCYPYRLNFKESIVTLKGKVRPADRQHTCSTGFGDAANTMTSANSEELRAIREHGGKVPAIPGPVTCDP